MIWGWFKKLMRLLVVSSLLMVFLIGLLFFYPKLLLNSGSLRLLAALSSTYGKTLHWETLQVDTHLISFFERRITVRGNQLCFHWNDPEVSGCFSQFLGEATVDLSHFPPRVTGIGPLQIHSELAEVKLKPGEESSSNENPFFESLQDGISWIRKAHLKDSEIIFKKVLISGSDQVWILKTHLVSQEGKGRHEPFFDWNLSAISNQSGKIQIQSQFQFPNQKAEGVEYSIDFFQKKSLYQSRVRVSGKVYPNRVTSVSSGRIQPGVAPISDLAFDQCKLDLKNEKKGDTVLLNCPLTLDFNFKDHPLSRLRELQKHRFVLQSELQVGNLLEIAQSPIRGFVEMEVLSQSHLNLKGSGKMRLNVEGNLDQFPRRLNVIPDFNLGFKMIEFQKIVKELEGSPWEIPAPFHALRGDLELKLQESDKSSLFEIPFQIKTHLASRDQKLNLKGNGKVSFQEKDSSWKPRLELLVILSNLQLVLPDFDLHGLPKLLPDPRFQEKLKKKKIEDPDPFDFSIQVKSPKSSPIQILCNLSEVPVPIHLNLRAKTVGPLVGHVRVEKFPIQLFHRKAKLEYFNLNFKEVAKESTLDGSVRVDYADYKIGIKVQSTFEKPIVRIESDPPLSENDAIATLLYGEPLSSLDSEQRSSVGSTRSAVVQDQAMTFASLFVFASTPIQSVSYDRTSGVVSAKVKIGKTTSLNLGSDTSEIRTLGVRKRLGQHWVIQTDLNDPLDQHSRGLSTFFEWNYRH
jgi:hypothetical protein